MAERKTRISTKLREAIRLMVEEGQKRSVAAHNAGMHDDSLRKALKRPDVLAYRGELMEMLRTGAASRTIARAEKLADEAVSEHVRLDANTWLAGIAGIAPVSRSEAVVRHDIQVPGLCIVIAHRDQGAIDAPHVVIEGRSLPKPVPHPAMLERDE